MATRLTAAKLKELQLQRHEEGLERLENERLRAERERIRNQFIEDQNKKEVARLAKLENARLQKIDRQNKREVARLAELEKAWNEQERSLLQSAIGGNLRFYCSCLIWPDRLIDAGFRLFQHDINKLSRAILESERKSENISRQISKALAQAIAALSEGLLARFGNVAAIKAVFDAAHNIRILNDERPSFRETLTQADPFFDRIDTKPADDILDRLEALYIEYEGEYFTTETLEMQLYSEEMEQEYDDCYPDDVTPARTSIESGSNAERLLPCRGARLRVSWENDRKTETVNFDFTATTLVWIATAGQALFNHIDKVISEFPLNVTTYAFDVVKNIHGQYLICAGVNKFYESPPPSFLLTCMQAQGFKAVLTSTADEEASISIKW